MAGILTTIGDFVTGRAVDAVTVIDALNQGKTAQTQLKIQELQVQEARANKAAAQAAAMNASKFFSNKTIETIIIWTVTTIAGGVLVSVVMSLIKGKK